MAAKNQPERIIFSDRKKSELEIQIKIQGDGPERQGA
jgi:hypothetical protein